MLLDREAHVSLLLRIVPVVAVLASTCLLVGGSSQPAAASAVACGTSVGQEQAYASGYSYNQTVFIDPTNYQVIGGGVNFDISAGGYDAATFVTQFYQADGGGYRYDSVYWAESGAGGLSTEAGWVFVTYCT
jgi:hypothetical protein